MIHRFKRDAAHELLDTVKYYESERPGLGGEFLVEITEAIATIKEAPMRWAIIEADIRRYRLGRFPYHLFYRIRDEVLMIIAVARQHRRPGYWRDRLH